jgi:hypothetical protein
MTNVVYYIFLTEDASICGETRLRLTLKKWIKVVGDFTHLTNTDVILLSLKFETCKERTCVILYWWHISSVVTVTETATLQRL